MRLLLAVALIAVPLIAFADEARIQVDHVWSRAAMAGHEGVVYLTITDTGSSDTLTGVTTPVAAIAELHQSFNDDGVMKMRPVPGPADQTRQPTDARAWRLPYHADGPENSH